MATSVAPAHPHWHIKDPPSIIGHPSPPELALSVSRSERDDRKAMCSHVARRLLSGVCIMSLVVVWTHQFSHWFPHWPWVLAGTRRKDREKWWGRMGQCLGAGKRLTTWSEPHRASVPRSTVYMYKVPAQVSYLYSIIGTKTTLSGTSLS